jgi:RNA polymerase-associated protein
MYMYRIERDWYGLADQILGGGKNAAKARKELRDELITTADILARKPYFMGDEFTLADASIAPLLWRLPLLGIELPPAQARLINGYALRLFQRDGFRLGLTEAEREMRPIVGASSA